jgi:hypothetical protein
MQKKHYSPKHEVGKVEHFYRRVLHILELIIAAVAVIVLVISLGLEIYKMVTNHGEYFADLHTFLHNILTIVVGLEFVRMLIDMTPGNTLEVLIMATARHIIMNHDNEWTLLIGIVCIAGLFAIRRFLIPRNQMTEDMVELE